MNDENKIREVLTRHHEAVRSFGHNPVMTVLVGSQNYGLATENSDYDTFTFTLPKVEDIATLKDPVSTTHEDWDGHINIKDIRLALNLLKKTSPNSVECFASKYYVVEPGFAELIEAARAPVMLRCDTHHMMAAICGMAHQLTKRNMSPGKRLSHILRMHCMVYNYFDNKKDILSMTEEELKLAMKAKLDPDNPKWNDLCDEYEKYVQEAIDDVDLDFFNDIEPHVRNTIKHIQMQFARMVLNYG